MYPILGDFIRNQFLIPSVILEDTNMCVAPQTDNK